MATRVNGHPDDPGFDEYADEEFVDDGSIDRDDLIFLVFALVASALLALYHAPLGLITLWVFTVAAWVRHRHPVARWALTFFAVVGLLGVLAITVTS